MLRFAEELLILVSDEGRGDAVIVPDRTLRYALAGAVLLDLALEHRTDSDPQALYLIDATPVGDTLLDPILAEIAREEHSQSCEFWVRRIAQQADEVRALAVERLVEQGILETDDGGSFFALTSRVARSRRYPRVADGEAEQETHARMMGILFSDDIPSPRDTVIISLVHACDLFRRILTPPEYDEVKERIEIIARLELVGRSVADAIRNMTLAESQTAQRIIAERGGGWPLASGCWPVLGHALKLTGDIVAYCTEQYLRHGPVFELKAPGWNFVVLAGQEANLFVIREGRAHLRSMETFEAMRREVGARNMIAALDGPDHRLLRKTMRHGYSRNLILQHIPEVVKIVEQELLEVAADRPVPVFRLMQRIMVEQIATVSARTSSRGHVDEADTFLRTLLMAHVVKRAPKMALRLPRVKRARRHMELLMEEVLSIHENEPRLADQRDLVDDLIELHLSAPDVMPAADLFINVISPLLIGLDTASGTAAFALYALLQHPDVAERVRQEAAELFAAGEPTPELYQRMEVTQRVVLETLRMHPIPGILAPRRVVNSFDFAGYRVPHGSTVLIVPAVTHNLPEFFPNPEQFDIDRYAPERREHVQPGAFAPFGLGHHACLGQGFAEVQLTLTLATLLHRADIAMASPGYRLKKTFAPVPRPDEKFKVRLQLRQ